LEQGKRGWSQEHLTDYYNAVDSLVAARTRKFKQ
jgi:hypothetical protein